MNYRTCPVFGGHYTLMLPMNPDQILVAQQAQALGAGHRLRRPGDLPFGASTLRKLTPTQVRHEVDRLIADQECQTVCATLKRKIEAANGASLAAQVLERVVTSKECENAAP